MLVHRLGFRWLGTFVLLGASTVLYAAEDSSRPLCTQDNAGELWPEAANHDPKAVLRLARCGDLQICVRKGKRFRWEPLTVRFDQLLGGPQSPKPSGCEAQSEISDPSRTTASNAAK